MAQFDVYHNRRSQSRESVPFLLDIQAEILEGLSTRMIVPLSPVDLVPWPLAVLNPVFLLEGKRVVALFDELSAYPKSELGEKAASFAKHRTEIMAALDFLIQGY